MINMVEDTKQNQNNETEKPTIDKLFEEYVGDTACEEYDWGEPQGKEIW